MEKKIKIAIIGLGYVGLPLAVEFGKKFTTYAYDISKEKINIFKKFKDPFTEISKKEFLSSKKLILTSDIKNVNKANFIIIAVPTPIYKNKKPNLKFLEKSSKSVASHMKRGSVVVYESTVYPGTTEEICIPILEKYSKLIWKEDFNVGYSPERINPGDKNKTLSKIVKVVSGDTKKTLRHISYVYSKIIKAGVHNANSIKVAEASKIIENTQRDINIALMNELSIIFNLMKIKTDDVLEAARTKWNFINFHPGLVGGHCIGVDPYYLSYKAKILGHNPIMIDSGRAINDYMPKYVANKIKTKFKNKKNNSQIKIIIYGISFKPNVPDFRNSKVIELFFFLEKSGYKVFVCDPIVNKNELFRDSKIKITQMRNLPQKVDVIIIGAAHDIFLKFKSDQITRNLKSNGIFYDINANFNQKEIKSKGFKVMNL